MNDPLFLITKKVVYYQTLRILNDSQLSLAMIANENIFQHPTTKRKPSNTHLYFRNYCNTIKMNYNIVNKQCSLGLDVAYRVYIDITKLRLLVKIMKFLCTFVLYL